MASGDVVRILRIGRLLRSSLTFSISAAADTAISAGFLPLMPSTPIGQTSESISRLRHALLPVALLKTASLGQ